MTDPDPDFRPLPGMVETLEPGLRRILAPNPSPMTFRGTNTYIIGEGDIAIIDPGPADPGHLEALLDAIRKEKVRCILVTHAHLDHSPLAPVLSEHCGAPVLAFGDAEAGRSATMQRLARTAMIGGGEGVDSAFRPDIALADGDPISGRDWTLHALHTPGHMANHLGFAWDDALFTGDLVMRWSTSLVSPPDGDMRAFMASLRALSERKWDRFHPGHGAAVDKCSERLAELISHRTARETAILSVIEDTPCTVETVTRRIYTELPEALFAAAERNVLAHLIDLCERDLVVSDTPFTPSARYARP
ncbi:MBL fold metallo-hydrolase [Cognatishimia sp. F0-27]|uniref:MBL fold metallo-hydrolase n=1 Tax=Cognatishimia sp. F0-27 TaxID=2816855 RepID=UPI001D0C2466|nr:MBL fold metallo-hydrolase [Cognatishimia sp. F0-27]MCC1492633.1 MBL fold metallo-hydrolase [Cognatishimia sp. F0-27]